MLRCLVSLSVLTLGAVVATQALAAPPPGEQVFDQRCGACHALDPAPGKLGPPLRGVVGRKAGTAAGYAYSDAMRKAALVWTPATLDRFLEAPNQAVPGTKMMISLADAQQRAAVAAYLKGLKKG
jgi:cytochrome c